MASTVTSTNNLSLRSILEKDKLTGSNFLDWERNLMIVLRHERKWYVLEEPLGEAPPANAPAAARNAHKKHSDDLLDVACLMLATMSPDLQTGLINTNAYDMIRQLRDMFQTQARTERYDATKAFNECKMVKGTSVSDHVMKMKRHLDHLERLGHPVPLQLATDTILNSLSEDYRPFVVNYNMNNMEKTVAELHSMLKTAELNMGNKNKTKDVLMVKDGGIKKKNGHASTSKGKGPVQAIQSAPKKGKGKGKGKKVKPNKARTENRCFICNEIGHWRQNCPKRHEAGSYDQLLNNSYKCCRLKVAQIFDRVANIGRDPRLRLLLGKSSTRGAFAGRSLVNYNSSNPAFIASACLDQKQRVSDHDPSQKVVLMQLLRQNQHLMQLLVRRQLMQQPMSWTMGMHSPRSSTSDNFWIFDSGCFNHMSPYPAGFIAKQPSQHPTVRTADLTPKPVLFSGNFSTDTIQLTDVLHVPGLAIGLLQEMGLLISFDFSGCIIQDPKTKQILGKGRRVGRTLEVVYLRLPLSLSHTNLTASVSTASSFDIWHARLGHLSSARIKLLANSGVLGNVTSNDISCLSGKLGKHHALPFELNDYTSVSAFDLIHSDVWGPAPYPSMGGHRYFVIFNDDHTRFTWIYLMKHRSELPQLYINFARMIQTQFSKPIKILRADNAMEYKESSLIAFLRSQGTISQYYCPGTSPQNGRAERKHRHILDTVCTLLVSAKCPERFWGEVAFTAVYTINRHPTPVLQHKSPYEVLHGVLLAYELLKVWGCACFVQLQPHEYTKLEPRGRLCLFLGYGIEHKGYRCWDPISKRLRISRHVTFWEDVPFYTMPNAETSITPTTTPFFTDPSSSFDTPISPPIPTIVPDSPTTTSDSLQPPTPEVPAESTDPAPSTSDTVRRSDRVIYVESMDLDENGFEMLDQLNGGLKRFLESDTPWNVVYRFLRLIY
ncbi:hypothetical protein OSB04_020819 [Centaurea solstitialis]|uniref:Integrase catalytic domain-containing protein n=1 Tax=Centaurea solstitialis TaxID=347529 RepID=A0AA38T4D3_9ASTR|nr:hypothetical protein OSB04_020819 [Centaurea solstitialis]